MRNRVSCTEVKGAEIKWMDVSIFRRETCQELAIDWPWELRDGEVTGMPWAFWFGQLQGWTREPWIH